MEAQKRGRLKLLYVLNLKYFTEKIIFSWQHQCIVQTNFWFDTKHTFHGRWKKIINNFTKQNFQCVWRCPIEKTKTFFFGKMFYYYFCQHPWKIYLNQFNMFTQTMNWCCYKMVVFYQGFGYIQRVLSVTLMWTDPVKMSSIDWATYYLWTDYNKEKN